MVAFHGDNDATRPLSETTPVSVRLKREQRPGRMLMQIHDELVFETPESDAESLIELVRFEMEHALPLSVPVKVDIAMGDNWLDAKG